MAAAAWMAPAELPYPLAAPDASVALAAATAAADADPNPVYVDAPTPVAVSRIPVTASAAAPATAWLMASVASIMLAGDAASASRLLPPLPLACVSAAFAFADESEKEAKDGMVAEGSGAMGSEGAEKWPLPMALTAATRKR